MREVGRPPVVDPHRRLRETSREAAHSARVIEVDVGDDDVGQVVGADPQLGEPLDHVRE